MMSTNPRDEDKAFHGPAGPNPSGEPAREDSASGADGTDAVLGSSRTVRTPAEMERINRLNAAEINWILEIGGGKKRKRAREGARGKKRRRGQS